MKFLPNIAAIAIAIVCVIAFSSVPALAAPTGTGTIPGQFTADNLKPTITKVTPSGPQTVECTPDSTTTLTFTVTCFDANGYADLKQLDAQLQDGATAVGPLVTVTSGKEVDAKTLDYTVNIVFQYYYTYGKNYQVEFTVSDQSLATGTRTSDPITYEQAAGITVESPALLNLGTLTYGQTSAPPQTATIHNSANSPIRIDGAAPQWTSDKAAQGASPVSSTSLYGGYGGTYVDMGAASPGKTIITNEPNGVKTPPPSRTLSFYEVVPPETPSFVLYGVYTTTITLTATAV